MYRGVSYRQCWLKKGKQFVFEPENPAAIWVEDAHEAIVSRELWDEVHRQLPYRKGKTHIDVHMLTGILVCPLCGNSFRVTTSDDGRGHRNTYYFCRSKRKQVNEYGEARRTASACSMRWLPLERTDKLVWDAFLRLITSPEMVEQYLASAEVEKQRSRLQAEIAHLEESAAQIESMMSRAREKLLTEILTDGEYLRERERLHAQLTGIQKRLVLKKVEFKSTRKEAGRQVIENLAMLKLGEKKLSRDQRSRLFHALVKRVVPRRADLKHVDIELYVTVAQETENVRLEEPAPRDQTEPISVTMRLPMKVAAT